ncbi:TetR/AcrR family transcriptional regulator [Pigmentiphaga sp. YJ18]|uniref:TetR/AcrR family transcriptional regulator n=1 Tax=unclassified Pigmentiphaga TaxID=2626614 RepID=UPI000B421CBB|nr:MULTISPECIES: TetR/AcrR family transcriptional regulator [unclassified Pigmentiphaga]OVZ58161.1 TetR family transcriptional regulator [Pigmentiphaga sp. NML030171]
MNELPTKATMKGEVLRGAILDAAAKLFIERGTGGTSMQDIAESLGLSRTAVYYYFKNKDAILRALTEEILTSARELANAAVSRQDRDPAEALRELVTDYANLILSRPAEFRVADRNESDLTQRQRASMHTARRSVLADFSGIIERGIQLGHFRMADPHVAAFGLIGMCNWTAWWFKPSGRLGQQEVAEAIADMAIHALRRDESRRARVPDVKESLRLLREDLAYLEKLVVPEDDASAGQRK